MRVSRLDQLMPSVSRICCGPSVAGFVPNRALDDALAETAEDCREVSRKGRRSVLDVIKTNIFRILALSNEGDPVNMH